MTDSNELNIYCDNQLMTVVEPIYENEGYWKPITGTIDYGTSEDIRMNVEFVWISSS